MAAIEIADNDEIVRVVANGNLDRDEEENVLGIMPEAFSLKGHDYLSVQWLNYFKDTDRAKRITALVIAARAAGKHGAGLKIRKSYAFAIIRVLKLKGATYSRGHKVRVLQEPIEHCPQHAGVHNFPAHDDDLLQLLAQSDWSEYVLDRDIPD